MSPKQLKHDGDLSSRPITLSEEDGAPIQRVAPSKSGRDNFNRSNPYRGSLYSIATQKPSLTYSWPHEEILMAEQLSLEEQRYLFGTLKRPARIYGRTTTDNEIEMTAYMNNQQTWNAAGSRFKFFSAACLGMSAIVFLYWSSYLSSLEQGLTLGEHISKEGSISGMYRNKAAPSAPNQLFEAFMGCAALLILFSDFGFHLLPRWENEEDLNSRPDRIGWCASECFRMAICFNYKRVESTSNWVVGEEGLFKLAWQIMMPVTLLLLAMVPLPQAENRNKVQLTCHTAIAIVNFITYTVCELYQLIRGERMFRRSTGPIQKGRLACMIFAIIGQFVYLGTQNLPKHKDSWGAFCSATFETAGFFFVLLDMMLICFIPIKAEQSVFALGGSNFRKENCRIKSEWHLDSEKTKHNHDEEDGYGSTESFESLLFERFGAVSQRRASKNISDVSLDDEC